MSEWWWVMAGYGLTLMSVAGYMLLLSRRRRRSDDDAGNRP